MILSLLQSITPNMKLQNNTCL